MKVFETEDLSENLSVRMFYSNANCLNPSRATIKVSQKFKIFEKNQV